MACYYHLASFVLSILLLISISPTFSFGKDAAAESEKVTLSLYYESLCPFCASFIENQLENVFDSDLSTIVNFRLVPYGNAQISGPEERIICQHGENECYLNTIHACAINAWPDVKKHFKLIWCIEGRASSGTQPEEAWRKCCNELGFSQQSIDSCYQSGEGTNLVLKYGEETDSLKPPHRFVPWVTVNNQALEEDYGNYIAYVCKAYKGKFLPHACKSRRQESTMKETSTLPLCFKGETRESSLFKAATKIPTSAENSKTKLAKIETTA